MKKVLILIVALAASHCLSARAADVPEAKANFTKYCKGCHGEDGKGETKLGKLNKVRDYSDPKVQESVTDEQIFKAIKAGFKKDDKEVMKPLAEKMSDDEIKALVKHLRTLKK